jgi:putative transposase
MNFALSKDLKRFLPLQTDNGSEFHQHFRDYLDKKTIIIHYFNYPRRPYKQGHIERYNRSLQEEFIDRNTYKLVEVNQFNCELMDYLIWYNTKRPHWSLNLKSPVDYLIQNNHLSKMWWTDTLS